MKQDHQDQHRDARYWDGYAAACQVWAERCRKDGALQGEADALEAMRKATQLAMLTREKDAPREGESPEQWAARFLAALDGDA